MIRLRAAGTDAGGPAWPPFGISVPWRSGGGGTGCLAGLQGAGTLHIRTADETAHRFVLGGESVPPR